MNYDRYRAPKAEVRDPDMPAIPPKPRAVKRAVWLLWLALVLSLLILLLHALVRWGQDDNVALDAAMLLDVIYVGVMDSIFSVLVWQVARCKNWARWGLMLFEIFNLSMFATSAYGIEFNLPTWEFLFTSLLFGCEFWALWLLFFGVGARWFKRLPIE